jgi:hypothetical protein
MGGFKDFAKGLIGGESKSEKQLRKLAGAGFETKALQKFLPPSLRIGQTGEFLEGGIQGIGRLISRPGELSPTVASAIRPRVAAESERISQNFRGIRRSRLRWLLRST